MKLQAAALLLLACAAGTKARAPASAPAGAPMAGMKAKSDLSFVLTADKATFKSSTMLKLTGVAKAVPYFSGARVSSMPLGAFANGAPGSPLLSADGAWLDTPQALLYGADASGNLSSVALNLQSVRFYNETGALKFNVTLVAPQAASLKLKDGPVGTAITDSKQGTGPTLATMVQANTTWMAVTLVVETTRTALKPMAETKTFGLFFGNGGWGNGWNNGYYGNNWGGGYNNYNSWGNGGGWGWGRR